MLQQRARAARLPRVPGRAKDTLVLSNGENVQPQAIEDAICTSPLIARAILVRRACVCVVAHERLHVHEQQGRRFEHNSVRTIAVDCRADGCHARRVWTRLVSERGHWWWGACAAWMSDLPSVMCCSRKPCTPPPPPKCDSWGTSLVQVGDGHRFVGALLVPDEQALAATPEALDSSGVWHGGSRVHTSHGSKHARALPLTRRARDRPVHRPAA